MHKKILLPLLLSTGYLTISKLQATYAGNSLQSKLAADVLHLSALIPNTNNAKIYHRAWLKSKTGYTLPTKIKHRYQVVPYRNVANCYQLIPIGSHPTRIIFYLHGGGYISDPRGVHFAMLRKLANATNAKVILPVYPKTPYYHARDVYQYITNVYHQVLRNEHLTDITFMGDSSGGGLALGYLQHLRDYQQPLPTKAILLSPWLDVSNTNPQMPAVQKHDPMLNIANLTTAGAIFAGSYGVKNPLVSPIYGDFNKLPPIYLFTGTHDILYPDVAKLTAMAKKDNLALTTFVFKDMLHVFSLLPIPEATKSLQMMTNLIIKNDL